MEIHSLILSLHTGNRLIIKLGDKEVEFNPDFKFYITTKLSNPQYTPEISTKAAIVNFAVKEQGLEAQLLGIVVRKERPELEEQKDSLVVNIAQSKKKLVELEDEILRYWITHFYLCYWWSYVRDCEGWWLSDGHSSVVEYWQFKRGALGLILATAALSHSSFSTTKMLLQSI